MISLGKLFYLKKNPEKHEKYKRKLFKPRPQPTLAASPTVPRPSQLPTNTRSWYDCYQSSSKLYTSGCACKRDRKSVKSLN